MATTDYLRCLELPDCGALRDVDRDLLLLLELVSALKAHHVDAAQVQRRAPVVRRPLATRQHRPTQVEE